MRAWLAYRSIRRWLMLLWLALVLGACSSPVTAPPARQPSPTDSPLAASPTQSATPSAPQPTPSPTQDAIRAGIQQTLDRYVQAYNQNDAALLQRAIDPRNLPFRRFIRTRFDEYQASFRQGRPLPAFHAVSVEPRSDGFVLAHLQVERGNAADWLFRQVGREWLLSEPTVEQIGKPVKIERGSFTFVTYPWADDVNARIIDLMERARQHVVSRLGKQPTQRATVEIKPIYGLTPYDNPFYVAYYSSNRNPAGPDRIEIFTPNSFNFGFYDPEDGWEQSLEIILRHEYTHMVHTRSFDHAGYLTTWMSEGLAEYVADNPGIARVRTALRAGVIIPIVDRQSAVQKQDLMHIPTLNKDRDLGYAFAQSLVRYTVEQYGGLDAFWRLARAYDESQSLDTALRTALHVPYDQFDRDWRAWLKKTF